MDYTEKINEAFDDPETKHAISEKYDRLIKSEKLAKQSREIGNALFSEVAHYDLTHQRIWDSYLKSIALSPANSESLATSYGNMSALLYHLTEFEACIKDCDKALEITQSIPLTVKLLCRKAKCYASLNRPEVEETYEKAKIWLNQMNDNDNKKEELTKLLDRAKIVLDKKKVKNECIPSSSIDSVIFTASNADMVETVKKKKGKKHKFDYQPLKGKSTHMKVLAKKEKYGVFSSVRINQDDTYGKHFVTFKNIKPGEVIFVTKPLIIVPNFRKIHNYCNHCLDPLWSCIPCENCSSCLWCSEECKKEAMQQYHDIECQIIPYVIFGDEGSDYAVQGSLRAVIKAVREFGSIENVKDEVDNIKNFEDMNHGYSRDGKFRWNSFISIFSFKNVHVDSLYLDYLAKASCRNVVALARFTHFFGEDKHFDTIESLQKDEEASFIATLMLRVAAIIYKNGIKVLESEWKCPQNNDQACISTFPCCERGYTVNTIGNFIPHCCDPTVKTIKSNGCKEICYALQPIYKGDPLLECYGSPFFEMSLSNRCEKTAQIINSYCTCIACTENWPPVLAVEGRSMDFDELLNTVVFSREHYYEKVRILDLVEKYGFAHQHVVDELSKIIRANFEYFGQPSAETSAAMCLLHYAFDALYANKLQFPNKCSAPAGLEFPKYCKKT